MSQSYPHEILIGCSGWSYPDWDGSFYPEGMPAGDYLGFYAEHFPVVEVDSTFYRPPSKVTVRGWRDKTPSSFRFALKVPRVITHEKQLRDCQEEVDGFVTSIEGLGDKLTTVLLQLGYFNRSAFSGLSEFLDVLDPFLAAWPHEKAPLALETRNPKWVGPELLEMLRAYGTSFTLTDQSWMPRPSEILEQLDPLTGPLSFIRLLGDREAIEKVASKWDKIVLDRTGDVAENAEVIKILAQRAPVLVFINNHYAGHSPATARELRARLGLPEPTPPPRPRTTLFD